MFFHLPEPSSPPSLPLSKRSSVKLDSGVFNLRFEPSLTLSLVSLTVSPSSWQLWNSLNRCTFSCVNCNSAVCIRTVGRGANKFSIVNELLIVFTVDAIFCFMRERRTIFRLNDRDRLDTSFQRHRRTPSERDSRLRFKNTMCGDGAPNIPDRDGRSSGDLFFS